MASTTPTGREDFSVSLSASARFNVRDHSTGQTSPHIVHVVSVSQPVQSWTVLRDHVDFVAMDVALGCVASGLPSCAAFPARGVSQGEQHEVDTVVQARQAAQDWLMSVLMVPVVRESPIMRQFLCHGANFVPSQFEGLEWVTFATNAHVPNRPSTAVTSVGDVRPSPPGFNLDEMDMDVMFASDDDGEEANEDSEDEAEYLQGRFAPTEELLTQSEIMEIQQDYKEVEMVEDVGSLAQSLGASHLGRSLNLQKEMEVKPIKGGWAPGLQQHHTYAGVASIQSSHPDPSGGIGGAVASAVDYSQHQSQEGLGDSFLRTLPVSAPSLDSFKMIKVIGKGSFGKVFLVREKITNQMFALKVLKKDNIIKRNQVEHTKTERSVLGYVKHPFIVGLNMAFQSKDKLYFVLDYCAGGELFFHLGKVGKFSEHRACFYAAEITLAIDYVHGLDIVYRDLKPENVLLDSRGHVRLTDFGLSKEGISKSSSGAHSFCGTPEYLAPEILNRHGHGRAVDWWSLGALLFEMLTGLPPFYCRDREKLFEKIRKGTLEYPRYLSPSSQVILKGLLTKDPHERLGSGPNDADDVKSQDFFVGLEWEKLMKGEVAPPWDPQINGSLDTSQFDQEFTNMPLNSPGGHGLGTPGGDNVFEGFTFTDSSFYVPPSSKTS